MNHLDPPMSALQAMELSEREDRVVNLRYSFGLAKGLFDDCDTENADREAGTVDYTGERWHVRLHGWNGIDEKLPGLP